MLPKMDGLSVLKELRSKGVAVPVLLLTARFRIEDKVNGLDCGADDYLPKPFHTDELLARLRALSRRKAELHPDGVLQYGQTSLNPHTLTLCCGGREQALTLKETQLLELLIINKGLTVSKETIIEKLWGYDSDAEDSHVEIQMSLLRKKMNQVIADISIRTIRGAGYVLSNIS